jgi:hypothetical protein
MIFLVLMLVVAAFWLVPRFVVPMAVKVPRRVPQQWVEEYGTRHR